VAVCRLCSVAASTAAAVAALARHGSARLGAGMMASRQGSSRDQGSAVGSRAFVMQALISNTQICIAFDRTERCYNARNRSINYSEFGPFGMGPKFISLGTGTYEPHMCIYQ
jgi:hypothetical protein